MLTVRISKLDPRSVLDADNYMWLSERIGKSLPVVGLCYAHTTHRLFEVTVMREYHPEPKVICIFVLDSATELKLEGDLQ